MVEIMVMDEAATVPKELPKIERIQPMNRKMLRQGKGWRCQKCGSMDCERRPGVRSKFGKSAGGRYCVKCNHKNN